MQWLIDIIVARVIADIGIPPVYIDRGDPGTWDFIKGDLTQDGAWHDLDLSAIVPAGAQAVALSVTARNVGASRLLQLRKNGNFRPYNAAIINTQVAGIALFADTIIALDTNRIIEYNATALGWQDLKIVIKGWWL